MGRRSIHKKLFLLLTLMGIIPIAVVLVYSGFRLADHMEQHAKNTGWLNNTIVNEHLSNILQNNFYTLHTIADAPTIKKYLTTGSPEDEAALIQLIRSNDNLFRDNNITAVTNTAGQQLLRSDGSPLVDVSQCRHFQEAMAGRDYASDIIVSMSTGKMMVALEVPVFNDQRQPIGMLQRNLTLDNLQEFITKQSVNDISILVLDQENKVIANSHPDADEPEDPDYYKKIIRVMDEENGVARIELLGKNYFVTCSRNQLTNWSVATIQPASVVYRTANEEVARVGIIGLLLLILVSISAHIMATRLTIPIRKICKVVTDIVKGNDDEKQLSILSEDELGEMAMAINEIRAIRNNMKQENETDALTGLASRAAVESICRQRLQEYEESFAPGMMAIFLIDLDNFKKATKEDGHQYGNRILQKFAQGLKDIFRSYDTVGHLDSDEFVVIIDHQKDLTIIKRKAEEINKMARELMIGDTNAGISASIGIAVSPQNGKTYNHLFHAADLALFAAKEKGRNSYHIAGEDEGEFVGLENQTDSKS
jgi:diguanylate cyclase (GGDEF)-like protein